VTRRAYSAGQRDQSCETQQDSSSRAMVRQENQNAWNTGRGFSSESENGRPTSVRILPLHIGLWDYWVLVICHWRMKTLG